MSVPKSFEEFNASLSQQSAPSSWPEALRAMWFDANGDWESSHDIAQDLRPHRPGRFHLGEMLYGRLTQANVETT